MERNQVTWNKNRHNLKIVRVLFRFSTSVFFFVFVFFLQTSDLANNHHGSKDSIGVHTERTLLSFFLLWFCGLMLFCCSQDEERKNVFFFVVMVRFSGLLQNLFWISLRFLFFVPSLFVGAMTHQISSFIDFGSLPASCYGLKCCQKKNVAVVPCLPVSCFCQWFFDRKSKVFLLLVSLLE